MTPKELHEACYDAICQCPQFRCYDDDMHFQEFGEFGDIPKKGIVNVIKFWREDKYLWELGYSEELPQECLDLFEKIESLLEKAIKDALK